VLTCGSRLTFRRVRLRLNPLLSVSLKETIQGQRISQFDRKLDSRSNRIVQKYLLQASFPPPRFPFLLVIAITVMVPSTMQVATATIGLRR